MNTRRSTAGAVVVRYHLEPTKVQIFLRCSDQKLDVRRKRNDFEKKFQMLIFENFKNFNPPENSRLRFKNLKTRNFLNRDFLVKADIFSHMMRWPGQGSPHQNRSASVRFWKSRTDSDQNQWNLSGPLIPVRILPQKTVCDSFPPRSSVIVNFRPRFFSEIQKVSVIIFPCGKIVIRSGLMHLIYL